MPRGWGWGGGPRRSTWTEEIHRNPSELVGRMDGWGRNSKKNDDDDDDDDDEGQPSTTYLLSSELQTANPIAVFSPEGEGWILQPDRTTATRVSGFCSLAREKPHGRGKKSQAASGRVVARVHSSIPTNGDRSGIPRPRASHRKENNTQSPKIRTTMSHKYPTRTSRN